MSHRSKKRPPILPTRLTTAQQKQVDEAYQEACKRVLSDIPAILAYIENEELQNLVYRLAFKTGEVLPKRLSRPQTLVVHLTEQIFLAHDGAEEKLPSLRRIANVVQEYYDILDDIVDGDVKPGYEAQAMVVSQLLMPILLVELTKLGPGACLYWARRALSMVESLYLEKCKPKSWETYLWSLQGQSYLMAFCTGLATLVSGQDDVAIERAEQIGHLAYRYGQFFLDLEQQETDDAANWNALHFKPKEDVLAIMGGWSQQLQAACEALKEPHGLHIWGLFSLDLEAFARVSTKANSRKHENR